jgi:hypothetical protein
MKIMISTENVKKIKKRIKGIRKHRGGKFGQSPIYTYMKIS